MPHHSELETILAEQGITGALRFLNQRTPHRFTALYRFDNDQLVNLYLIDRERFDAPVWPTIPIKESYCAIVKATRAPVVLANSLLDARVHDHEARERVVSYCGVPLAFPDGRLFGSVCHFDHKPILFSHLDLEFLEAAAPLLVQAILAD